ncbi:MAG TPA: HD domain-containing protein [Opitutaceae bacterium]|jgi:hypothetical protein
MPPPIDFESSSAVAEFVRTRFAVLHPRASDALLTRLFVDVDAMFSGRHPAYERNTLKYHNFEHTLRASACMAEILEGHGSVEDGIRLEARDFELAIAAVLLHDAGYLKLKSDIAGTGAKYTFCHILRSCAFAASYLPEVGANDAEIDGVLTAINCTGPNSEINRLRFRNGAGRLVGSALATADYLGQLSDPGYPEKLGELFRELKESDDFSNVPPERRMFKSLNDLVCGTPAFWTQVVRPRLDGDFQGLYRLLARPVPAGRNAYLEAIEANLARISRWVDGLRAADG